MNLSTLVMRYTLRVYIKHKKNKLLTADELGISLKTLYNWLKRPTWGEHLERLEKRTRDRQSGQANPG